MYIQRGFFLRVCVLSDGDYRVDSFMGIPCFKVLEASSWKSFLSHIQLGMAGRQSFFFFMWKLFGPNDKRLILDSLNAAAHMALL